MTKHERAQLDMFPDSPQALQIRADEALALRVRIETILEMVAVAIRPCGACPAKIYFVPNPKTNKLIPFQGDGQSHFKNCPQAAEFTKK